MTEVLSARGSETPARTSLIDCDVHNVVPRVDALFPYLPEYWVEHVNQTLFKGAVDSSYPPRAPTTVRPDAKPENGDPAGSSLAQLRRQVLEEAGADLAILACTYAIDSIRNPDAAVAFASAVNDWQIAEWLDKEPRLRASIVVPNQIPHLAAREIDRVAKHPGFVQVLLPARSHHPYGNRLYHPLWDAIARNDVVAGIHFGGAPGVPPTPSGWPSYYLEEYAGMAQVFASQLTSIVSEGVFDSFPNVRIALLEAGFTWLPAHMWRFDKEWRNLRRLVPWVRRPPSDYIREHVRLTIQPLDAPPNQQQMLKLIEHLGSDDMLLYASDYPHRHAHDPARDLLPDLPPALANKIRHENARALYRV